MKAATETIAEVLACSDQANMAKVRPRVRLAFIRTLKRLIARTFAG